MKKLFVSVPMKGRTQDEIRASVAKMHKIAEVFEGEPLELIDSFVSDTPPMNNHQAIWYLGKSLEKLSDADIVISIDDYWSWNGCAIEVDTAHKYGIKCYTVSADVVISNYKAVIEKNYSNIPVN